MNKGFTYLKLFKRSPFSLLFSCFRHALNGSRKHILNYDRKGSLCLNTCNETGITQSD
jgi:hypothetical protein